VVTVEGFYDDVEPLTEEERKMMAKVPSEDFAKVCGVKTTASEKGYTAVEHTMGRPTFEINGIYGGYQGEGTKTIIPSTATAKITCRLVPGQDPEKIQQLIENHINKVTPSGVTVTVKMEKIIC
jgi:acetylornithine deacetylase/succinyl-diaminopimelate desuccinylase-like protein